MTEKLRCTAEFGEEITTIQIPSYVFDRVLEYVAQLAGDKLTGYRVASTGQAVGRQIQKPIRLIGGVSIGNQRRDGAGTRKVLTLAAGE